MGTMHNAKQLSKGDLCPYCKADLDGVSEIESESRPHRESNQPGPGDYTICVHCAGLCVWDEDMNLQKPTPEELDRIDPKTRALLCTVSEVARQAQARSKSHLN